MNVDVAIVGGGVVGAAIAWELAHFDLEIVLIEAKDDVGAGTSKANTAILHTGFDATPESLESRLVRRGYERMLSYAEEVGIAVEKTGALLIAWNTEEFSRFGEILEKARKNGVANATVLSVDELYKYEPNLGKGALGAICIPGESIICPFTPVIAYATEAIENGVELLLESPVTAIHQEGSSFRIQAGSQEIHSRWVINAAGLQSDSIDGQLGFSRFHVRPRRGELIVFDKLARSLLNHILLPIPTKTTKGVLVSPTVFGNVLLGPTAEDIDDKEATATTGKGLRSLWEKGEKILPALMEEEVTSTYTGLRAATEFSDYQLYVEKNYICVGGIRSTGLSASLGISEYVASILGEAGVQLTPKKKFVRVKMPPLGEAQGRRCEDPQAIEFDPDFGRIICHCERVSVAEIRNALQSPIPPKTFDGLRRRTRCLQGRCQGFFCMAAVDEMLSQRGVR